MLSTLIVFGAGYVLGSKAGRERYNQIVALAQEAARRLDQYGARSWLPAEESSNDYLTGTRSGARTRRR
jgi:hypothetical protein